jgi:predicted histone-like DNA-binding protein
MQYDLRQNNNDQNSAYGKRYPKAVVTSTLNLRGLANHIAEHGSPYTEDVVKGVLEKFTSCMVELVKQGVGVKLDGLGKFYPTLEAKGATTPISYDLATNLSGVHIRFRPEGVLDDDITSRQLKSKVMFAQRLIIDKNGVPKKIKDGQLVDYGEGDDEQG